MGGGGQLPMQEYPAKVCTVLEMVYSGALRSKRMFRLLMDDL